MTLTNNQKGILLAFAGVMLLTPDSLLIRLITLDTWSLLFYRSLVPGLFLFILSGSAPKFAEPSFVKDITVTLYF